MCKHFSQLRITDSTACSRPPPLSSLEKMLLKLLVVLPPAPPAQPPPLHPPERSPSDVAPSSLHNLPLASPLPLFTVCKHFSVCAHLQVLFTVYTATSTFGPTKIAPGTLHGVQAFLAAPNHGFQRMEAHRRAVSENRRHTASRAAATARTHVLEGCPDECPCGGVDQLLSGRQRRPGHVRTELMVFWCGYVVGWYCC